jgi:hypothetical protein
MEGSQKKKKTSCDSQCNIVFKHSVAVMYLIAYTYISVLTATYYLVTLFPHYMFPSSGVAYLAQTVVLYVKVMYRV